MVEIVVANLGEIILFIVIALIVMGGGGLLFKGLDSIIPLSSHKYSGTSKDYPDNWESLRSSALSRDGHRCGNCGSTNNLHVHHIVPMSKGGSNILSNLRTLCEDCHARLHPHMR